LPLDRNVSAQNSFSLVSGNFARKHPDGVATINDAVATTATYADQHRDQVAAIASDQRPRCFLTGHDERRSDACSVAAKAAATRAAQALAERSSVTVAVGRGDKRKIAE
jgi:hypothetical protein